ncbi:MAG: baseplate J/gp47 family protein [Oscillospiraceae bacterium]|nr:baseplate J/gp47 family protein [Oscillospiraceae bacterium]
MSLFKVTNQGVITVDTSEVKADLEEAYKEALGYELNIDTGTPQGQMIVNDVKTLTYAQEQAVLALNSFSVLTAKGDALDIAAGIWGYYRKQDVSTVVSVRLNGSAGTNIPLGTLFSNGSNQFSLLDAVTITPSGFVVGQAQCTETGAIPCIANTLTEIVTPVNGLDSVNNPSDGIMGYARESDSTFRKRITDNWLNIRGRSILGAIIDNVAALDGVISVIGRENYATTSRIIDGVSMQPHSIYLDVLGGSGSDIAKVLTEQKTLGAATNGSIQVIYNDDIVGYPYSYNIARPSVVDVYVQIEYENNYYTPANVEQDIINQMTAYIQENPFMIGETISGNELSNALTNFEYANILSVKVSTFNADFVDYVQTNIQQVGVVSSGNISVKLVNNVV